jgi:hypothetical protein
MAEEKNADQVGKNIYHRIYTKPLDEEDKEQKRINGLASMMYNMCVMSEEEAFGNANFRISRSHFENMEGCQAIVKVSRRAAKEYTDKLTGEKKMGKESFDVWSNDVYHLEHEKVKDVPRDWEMAQMAAKVGGGRCEDQMQNDLDGI